METGVNSTVFKGGQIFRDGGFESADVLIEDGRITDVGHELAGDETIDCAGLVLLPGLFDTHVHLGLPGMDLLDLGKSLGEAPRPSSCVFRRRRARPLLSASPPCATPVVPGAGTSRRLTVATWSGPGCKPPSRCCR